MAKPVEPETLEIQPIRGAAEDAVAAALTLRGMLPEEITGPDDRVYLPLPENYRLHELPDRAQLAPWPKQRVTVDDRASLVSYTNRFKDSRSVLVADYDAGTISARLDWHHASDVGEFGHSAITGPDAHSVTLKLRLSEEFTRWNNFSLAVAGQYHRQDEFARFLEENSVDVGFPEAAALVEIARDFEAVSGQSYKTTTRLDNGDRKLIYETESKVTSNVIVPERFTVHIPIYNGEEPSDLVAIFRWRANGQGAVGMGYDWYRVDHQRRAHFAEIAALAADETGLPVYMGRSATS